MLIAAFALTAAIAAPILATAGSRIDRRKLLTASLAICAVANLLAAVSQTYGQLMAARVLAAITSAVYTPQVAATVSMLVPERERGPSLAKLMMGWAIGSVAGSPLVVLIGTSYGWRMALALIGVSSGCIALLVYRAVPAGVKVPALNWQRWIEVGRSPALLLLSATTGLNSVGNIAMNSSIGYLGTSLGTTLGATAWTLVGPRYMTWIGLLFVLASFTCSMYGERAAARSQAKPG